jgi:drug/metabolite transporter (DMT)-like permease
VSTRPTTLAGIALALAAVLCFSVLDLTVKWVASTVPLLTVLWVRFVIQAVSTTAFIAPQISWALLRTQHPKFQVLRGLLLLSTAMLAFVGLKYLPVGEFTAIVMITPLVVTAFTALVYKTRVSPLRWALVVGGFLGVLIIVRPWGHRFAWVDLLPLTWVAINTAFQLLTAQLARTEHPLTLHFYTGWVGALAITVIIPFAWVAPPDAQTWLFLLLIGLAGSFGHFLLILAYRKATALVVTPYLYAQIALAVLGGWLVFGHMPDGWALSGMALVILCGAVSAYVSIMENRTSSEASGG